MLLVQSQLGIIHYTAVVTTVTAAAPTSNNKLIQDICLTTLPGTYIDACVTLSKHVVTLSTCIRQLL